MPRAPGRAALRINGHGETTILEGWVETFRPFLRQFRVSLTSNLARPFDDGEIDFLSRLRCLNVSMDVADPALLKSIRRSVDRRVIERNIARIISACVARREAPPLLVLCAGVYDRSVMQLPGLAEFAGANCFSHVVFWSLVQAPGLPGHRNVRSLSALAPETGRAAIAAIDSTVTRLEALGISHEFVGGFFEVFKRQTEARAREATVDPPAEPMIANRIFEAAEQGETKNCFNPWTCSQVSATGEVFPCCAHRPIGTITGLRRYREILDGEPLRQLRHNLLAGTLDDDCRACHLRENMPVTAFRVRHAREFAAAGAKAPPWRRAAGPVASRPDGSGTARSPLQRTRSWLWRLWTHLRAHWRGAAGSLDRPVDGTNCAGAVLVEGWLFALRSAPVSGRVHIDGHLVAELNLNQLRPDVHDTLRCLGAPVRCGFRQNLLVPEAVKTRGVVSLWVDVSIGSRPTMRLGPVRIAVS